MPARIQMSRAKGWRKPEGAIYCGRPGLLGNPFPVDVYGQAEAVELHRRWLAGDMSAREMSGLSRCDRWSDPPSISLVGLRSWVLQSLVDLRGHDLGCWCPIHRQGDYVPCHADVLLSLANAIPLRSVIRENLQRAKREASQ